MSSLVAVPASIPFRWGGCSSTTLPPLGSSGSLCCCPPLLNFIPHSFHRPLMLVVSFISLAACMHAKVSSRFPSAPSAMPCVASPASLARGSWAPMGAPPAASLVGPSYHGMDVCPQPSLGVPSVHTSASLSPPSSSVSLLSRASRSPRASGRLRPPWLDSPDLAHLQPLGTFSRAQIRRSVPSVSRAWAMLGDAHPATSVPQSRRCSSVIPNWRSV